MGGERRRKEKQKFIVKPLFTLKLFMKIEWINVNKKKYFDKKREGLEA